MKIALQTLTSGLFGVVFFGVLLFLPAGTLNYWQAWVFMAVFIAATMIPSIYLAVKNPEALRRRMKAGPMAETRTVQKVVISGTILMVLAVTVVSSLDHRFGWSHVPTAVVVLGNVVVAIGLVIAQLVVIQNSYAAATITVEAEQKVVSTGLYGVGAPSDVRRDADHDDRHAACARLVLGTCQRSSRASRSWPSASSMRRRCCAKKLAGYTDYMQQVHYRLVPYVW